APARKFLLAGRGGLNLTHAEPLDTFLTRYGEAREFLEPAIRAFPPTALRDWCHGLGIETFVGSSGRVFPKTMKASPILRAWLRRLAGLGVTLRTGHTWQGFGDGPTILAMGGASWPRLGSDGGFAPILAREGIRIVPFQPANSRFLVPWSEHFIERFAGTPLKNVALTYGPHRARGEAMIASTGIEGGAIYTLSRHLREERHGPLLIDLKPDLSPDEVTARLARRRPKESLSNHLRKSLGLSPVAIALLRETKAQDVKSVPLAIGPPEGLARAISSAGGVARDEVDANFMLRRKPLCYAVGEMLDWEAPTGGYLLQACFSTAVAAARDCLRRMG
ncbi:MAG: TIGR03862 family flavoprotein, partial [Alphaproteobacteria bacterium]|nr:TIGR03862 family flavoprotein [Alphaproteobacteria bacterium]